MTRTARSLGFPLRPAERSAAGVAQAIVAAIAGGQLADGDWLPSTRALAAELGCSRTLTAAGYDRLLAAGYVEGVPGSGTRVSQGAGEAARAGVVTSVGARRPGVGGPGSEVARRPEHVRAPASRQPMEPGRTRAAGSGTGWVRAARPDSFTDLRPGRPDTALLNASAWRSAWRRAAEQVGADTPWEDESLPLAAALADHLRSTRGISAARPLLFPGTGPAVRVLLSVVPDVPVAVESPCYGAMHREFATVPGATDRPGGTRDQPLFVPVDGDGLVVSALPERPMLVYTTPAHQYPLGHRMSVARRHELVDWARRTGSLIVEDDYDGEFRFRVAPLPALRSIPGAEGHVAYLGTASKALSPELRVAWLDVPARLYPAVGAAAAASRLGVPGIVDRALADFIASGGLRRHLARAGRAYRDRREVLLGALAEHCPHVPVSGVDAGLHVTVGLPDGTRGRGDVAVADALVASGFGVAPLSAFPAGTRHSGLVIGYARASHTELRAFARALAASLGELVE